VLVAHTVVLAGLIGGRIWYEGMKLPAFQIEIAGTVALLMAIVLAPLTFFVLKLARAKREGARQYGLLAMRYVDEFREKWMRDRRPDGEPLVGSADIQPCGGSWPHWGWPPSRPRARSSPSGPGPPGAGPGRKSRCGSRPERATLALHSPVTRNRMGTRDRRCAEASGGGG
jgi:hypothetical protein